MQKTEKHCKNQCFCYHKATKISPKTGPKTQKSASGPGHLRNRKKRCCKPKNWGQKVEKHGFFHFSLADFTNRCLPYCFLQCFLKASVTTDQKQEVLAEKCPPPGKPVTFYECHPEDHAPAPSVRADFSQGAGGRSNPKRRAGRVCRACPNLGESSPSCGMRNHMNHIEMWLVATKKWAHVLMRGTLCAVPDFQSNPQWSIYLRHPDQVFFACSAAHRPIRSVTCGRILVDSSWL